jgi:hypothetical protein
MFRTVICFVFSSIFNNKIVEAVMFACLRSEAGITIANDLADFEPTSYGWLM